MSDLREADKWLENNPICDADELNKRERELVQAAWQAALSANGGDAVPVAWAVFADSGNIRIWGQEKPEAFPEAVPLYLSQTVKESLTAHLEPIGYADPDTLTDYRAGERLHIPVYRPDASAEWQSGIPVYLHPAPPSVAAPEGWDDDVAELLDQARKLQEAQYGPSAQTFTAAPPPDHSGGETDVRPSKHHTLKTDPAVFARSAAGRKPWEIRLNDRDFQVGDTVTLQETVFSGAQMREGAALGFTGKELTGQITYVLRGPKYGLADGWCIFSFEPDHIADAGKVVPIGYLTNQAVARLQSDKRLNGEHLYAFKPDDLSKFQAVCLAPTVNESLTIEDFNGMCRIVEAVSQMTDGFAIDQCHMDRAREIVQDAARLRTAGDEGEGA